MDRATLKRMMSSDKKDYGTPKSKFGFLHSLFDFKIDLCAVPKNAKLKKFYSPEDDAFTKKWNKTSWLNPPYGNPEYACKPNCKKKGCEKRGYHINEYVPGLIDWVRKARDDSKKYGSTIVCLIPSRTDTGWMQIAWDDAKAICYVRERWVFEGAKDGSPFPLALVVFSLDKLTRKQTIGLTKLGNVVPGSAVKKYRPFKRKG